MKKGKERKRWEEQKEMNKKMKGKMVKEKKWWKIKKCKNDSRKKVKQKKNGKKDMKFFGLIFFVRKLKRQKNFKRNFKKSFEIKNDYLNTVVVFL